jgi:hypothetical protein
MVFVGLAGVASLQERVEARWFCAPLTNLRLAPFLPVTRIRITTYPVSYHGARILPSISDTKIIFHYDYKLEKFLL